MTSTANLRNLGLALFAGLLITSVAAIAVTPVLAAGYPVDAKAEVTGVADWDVMNVRKWPAHYSQKIGALEAGTFVWVERCIEVPGSSDWCKVERADTYGWVNSRFLTLTDD